MVEAIGLGSPHGNGLEDPTQDVTFMARIGATQINGTQRKYELTNAVTGTRFVFQWVLQVRLFLENALFYKNGLPISGH